MLLENLVFPRLIFSEQKQQLWASDPVKFVPLSVGKCLPSRWFYPNDLLDEYVLFATPAAAAATFLLNAASN